MVAGVVVLVAIALGLVAVAHHRAGDPARDGIDAYLAGRGGEAYRSVEGRFRAVFPVLPSVGREGVRTTASSYELTAVRSTVGDVAVAVGWFDVDAQEPTDLVALARATASGLGARVVSRQSSAGSEGPVLDVLARSAPGGRPYVAIRLVEVDARVYELEATAPTRARARALLDGLAGSFAVGG